jgi:hypothetical protein
MDTKLMSCEHVPAGFEIAIGNKDVEMGKIWNLWFNITFSDDPGKWDEQITSINKMQMEVGELSSDQCARWLNGWIFTATFYLILGILLKILPQEVAARLYDEESWTKCTRMFLKTIHSSQSFNSESRKVDWKRLSSFFVEDFHRLCNFLLLGSTFRHDMRMF